MKFFCKMDTYIRKKIRYYKQIIIIQKEIVKEILKIINVITNYKEDATNKHN